MTYRHLPRLLATGRRADQLARVPVVRTRGPDALSPAHSVSFERKRRSSCRSLWGSWVSGTSRRQAFSAISVTNAWGFKAFKRSSRSGAEKEGGVGANGPAPGGGPSRSGRPITISICRVTTQITDFWCMNYKDRWQAAFGY